MEVKKKRKKRNGRYAYFGKIQLPYQSDILKLSSSHVTCCFSVTKLHLALCNPMDCSTPGSPVLHYLLLFTLIYVHWVNDTIQIAHALPPLILSLQYFPASGSFPKTWLFTPGGQSIGASASDLPMNIQGWFPLELTGLISIQSKRLLSLLQYHNLKASANSHMHTWLLEKP